MAIKKVVPTKKVAPKKVVRQRTAPVADVNDGPAQVPDDSILKWYIGRMIGGRREFDVFDAARSMSYNVLIEGPTGPGKTTAVEAYAAARKKKFYAIPSSVGATPDQLFGKMLPDGKGGWKFVDGPVTDIVRHGGVLLINEVNFLPERVAVVLFALLDGRRLIMLMDHENEVIKAHRPKGCWCDLTPEECEKRWVLILADMNPDYAGTRTLNAAFRNRFAIQLDWGYDAEVEAKLIPSLTLRSLMEAMRQHDTIFTPISTNMGQEFVKLTRGLGLDFAVANFTQHFDSDERPLVQSFLEAKSADLLHELKLVVDTDDDEDDDDDDDFDFNSDDFDIR